MYYDIKGMGYSIKEILNKKEKEVFKIEQLPKDREISNNFNFEMKQENNGNNENNENNGNNGNNGNNERETREPRYPSSDFQPIYTNDREAELMRELYTEINTFLYPFVVKALNEYEFIGSPIYSVMGVDRETIAQIVDRVINLAEESLDQVGEVKNERTGNYLREWDRWGLLRASVESLVLNDIFGIRRPAYFKKYAPASILKKF